MGISSSRQRQRQNANVTYAPQSAGPFGPYAPPAMYPRPAQQALPAPAPGATPAGYNEQMYRAHYMNHGQYQQYAWQPNGAGAAPPGNFPGAYPQAPPPQYHGRRTSVPQPQQEFTQTATIRNSVNLKKETLKLTHVDGDPTKLQINFTFDASAACCVTTFVMASEEPTCKIRTATQPAGPSLHYDRGLGHRFPKPGDSSGVQHVVDVSKYTDEQLRTAPGPTSGGPFPLVVRLETLTDKGSKEGRSLQELTPGHEHKTWVQSQTTYATIFKNEDGEYEVRVLEQKIWVEGTSYKLQEIYGMDAAGGKSSAGDASTSAAEDAEERLCVICLCNERDTTVLPCRHMCMCKDCAQELSKQTSKCPICRNTVESLLHIKVQRKSRSSKQQQQQPSSSSSTGAAAKVTAGATA